MTKKKNLPASSSDFDRFLQIRCFFLCVFTQFFFLLISRSSAFISRRPERNIKWESSHVVSLEVA